MKIISIGMGGHFNVLLDILNMNKLKITAVCSSNDKNIKSKFQIIDEKKISQLDPNKYKLVNSIGFNPENDIRKKIYKKYKDEGFKFFTIIHPSAIISRTAKIKEGSQILSSASILPNVIIGENCIINTKSSIDHDSIIDDNVNVSPNATICGNVRIKKNTYIGASSTILNNITIGQNCHIFPGSMVNKNIDDNSKYINGKIIKS